jgi:hypothetical protein
MQPCNLLTRSVCMRKAGWLIPILFIFTSCGGGALLRQSLMVDRGYTKKQVIEVLGPPGDRQFKGDDEAWQYCRTGISTDQFVIVWLYRGTVTGVTTYKAGSNAGYVGDCSQGFKTIRWENAPDRTIEFRYR